MYFIHSEAVWNAHPKLQALVISADSVRSAADSPQITRLAERAQARQEAATESEMPEIAAWREAFARMGLKPTQYRCASESLLRRYRKNKDMPSFHPVVDYLNHVSMAFATPIAVFDVDHVAEGITVRPADGSETYLTFQGETEQPAPGEIVFADTAGNAHARRWTYRQSALSVVSPTTDRVLIVIEAHHATAGQDLVAMEQEIRPGLKEMGVHPLSSMMIGPAERRFDFQQV